MRCEPCRRPAVRQLEGLWSGSGPVRWGRGVLVGEPSPSESLGMLVMRSRYVPSRMPARVTAALACGSVSVASSCSQW